MTEGIIIALIEVLEKKVEKHNNFIERMYVAETEITEIKEDIKELKDRL